MARDVEAASGCSTRSCPASSRATLESLEELEVGVAWTELADPLVRERVEAAAARFPRRARRAAARPERDVRASSCARSPTSTASSSPRTPTSTARTSRIKVERCLARHATPRSSGASALRAEYREQVEEALDGLDLLLTPTLPIVAPPLGRGRDRRSRRPRDADPLHAPRSTRSAGRRSRSRAAPAEDGLPASVQLVGPSRRRRARARRGAPARATSEGERRRAAADKLSDDAVRSRFARRSLPARARAHRRRRGADRRPHPAAPKGLQGVPAARRRGRQPRVLAHAVVRLAARRRRAPLRVRARDQQAFTESSIVWSNVDDELDGADDDHDSAPAAGSRLPPATASTDGYRQAGRALREPALAGGRRSTWRCPGSPARRTPSTRTCARSRRTARRPGASPLASTSAGRASRVTSTARTGAHPLVARRGRDRVPGLAARRRKRSFTTTTNVADARELYTFHRTTPLWTSTISFRVRAQRTLYGEVARGLPATTYGPWSPVYTDAQPPPSSGR